MANPAAIITMSMAVLFTWSAQTQDCAEETAKLLPADGARGDLFGNSVSLSGDTAVIGAYRHDAHGACSGSAYVFDAITGEQIAELLPDDCEINDWFGISVSVSGTTAIVGANMHDDNGHTTGSAYLFDVTTGQQKAELLAEDGAEGDWFGISVAIDGNTAIVGADGDRNDGVRTGSGYIFNAITGEQIAKLLPDDGAADDGFGHSVAISGPTAIVGAYLHDDNGLNSGSAYVFDVGTGRQLFELLPDDGAEGDWFGVSVAISGTTAIIGAYRDDDNGTDSGSAYLFNTMTGRQIAKLVANDGAEYDLFGASVAITGVTSIAGAPFGSDTGSAYLFNAAGEQVAKLLPDDGTVQELFGTSIAIVGVTAIVGASDDDDNGDISGSAYVFDLAPCGPCVHNPAWICDGDVDGDGQVNPVDSGLVQAAFGSVDEQDVCNYDVDCDGQINPVDSGVVQSLFGTCEAPREGCP